MTNNNPVLGQDQPDPIPVDNSRAMIDFEDMLYVREVLMSYDPDYVLESETTAKGLARYLADRGSRRALLVRTDSPDELGAILQDQFPGRVFDIVADPEEVAFLLDNMTYEGYVLLVPANLWMMAARLDETFPDYLLVSSVDLAELLSEIPERDFAPKLDEMKAHYRQYRNMQPVPAPPRIDATADLHAYSARHKTWPDVYSSAQMIISLRDGTVVGR